MDTSKIKEISELNAILKDEKRKKGFISGTFDVLNFENISLFEFAKEHWDLLIVGLDSDRSIRKNKGYSRPVFSEELRTKTLSGLDLIDYIVVLDHGFIFGSDELNNYYFDVLNQLKVNSFFTHGVSDLHIDQKKKLAHKLGIELFALD